MKERTEKNYKAQNDILEMNKNITLKVNVMGAWSINIRSIEINVDIDIAL